MRLRGQQCLGRSADRHHLPLQGECHFIDSLKALLLTHASLSLVLPEAPHLPVVQRGLPQGEPQGDQGRAQSTSLMFRNTPL
jgi:hypothetical protein